MVALFAHTMEPSLSRRTIFAIMDLLLLPPIFGIFITIYGQLLDLLPADAVLHRSFPGSPFQD